MHLKGKCLEEVSMMMRIWIPTWRKNDGKKWDSGLRKRRLKGNAMGVFRCRLGSYLRMIMVLGLFNIKEGS